MSTAAETTPTSFQEPSGAAGSSNNAITTTPGLTFWWGPASFACRWPTAGVLVVRGPYRPAQRRLTGSLRLQQRYQHGQGLLRRLDAGEALQACVCDGEFHFAAMMEVGSHDLKQ